MGIRSDVGIAVKAGPVLDAIKSHPVLATAEVIEEPEGTLFVLEAVKWYTSTDEEIADLYKQLRTVDPTEESYLIVEACSEYPESDIGDAGAWFDNPWALCRTLTVALYY